MKYSNKQYLELMTFGHSERSMFTELFGLLVGLENEWKAQGAMPDEINLTMFDWDVVPVVRQCGGNTGVFGGFEKTILEDTNEHIIWKDELRRTIKIRKGYATDPLPLDFPVKDMESWLQMKKFYEFSEDRINWEQVEISRKLQKEGHLVVGYIPGGFDTVRELMGEVNGCLAYYLQPELVHDIMQTLTDTSVKVYERITKKLTIDQLSVHEDMAGKNGPLIGPDEVSEFIKPYFSTVWELMSSQGTRLFDMDSDGNMDPIKTNNFNSMKTKNYKLIEIEWPEFGMCDRPEMASLEEFSGRMEKTRSRMEQGGLTHLVVYADREHFANLAWLTGFDPRFEEALLILDIKSKPLILFGNECEGRLNISPLFIAGQLKSERYQPFSLLDQPKNESRFLQDVFAEEGIGVQSVVGCVGWKYFSDMEHPDGKRTIEIPAFIVDVLRNLAGKERVVNATALFMNSDTGLRSFVSPAEIAYFEFTNILASEGMKNMLLNIKDGMLDYDLAILHRYNGEPQGAHITMKTGENRKIGLSGPMGTTIRRGAPFASNICYWGSNSCRAGWTAESAKDLPVEAQDYVENFAGPYFETMSEWFSLMKIGTTGGQIAAMMEERLPYDKFGVFLNQGHLIHLDEWLSSPIYKGSEIRIHSGMAMQADVIPSSPVYFSTRMEDGYIIADNMLRSRLKEQFPECYNRCMKRRDFMTGALGIELPDEILPLSNIPAIVPPFFLNPNLVFAMEK